MAPHETPKKGGRRPTEADSLPTSKPCAPEQPKEGMGGNHRETRS
ncbi:hypothetical protein HMPREF9278_0326 [Mobiluncus mulieris FB024-16]|nr:hypothetical protein HMPREF0577_0023 [Mobiluncus mulieris ATCC 35243]EFN92707.1 hypothetical protein HMPREF9278_0326 [Mobiluncus mulieris FB024-16]